MKIDDDKLGRTNYVKFLCHLIANCEKYKRESESKSFTMAIDSPWGTGKSVLLDFVIEELEKDKKFRVVRYNAWEHDFTDNPFEPLMYSILNSEIFDLNKEECNIVALIMGMGQVIKALAHDGANMIGFGETFKSTYNFVKNYVKVKNNENIELEEKSSNYLMQFGIFEAFRDALKNCRMDENETLVVMIDELDRCRPKFAIETLEIVKHLFNIPKVVFVFAVDVKQLGYSMTSAYGAQMDTAGYLLRFFDYVTRIPEPNLREYISYALGNSIVDNKIVNPLDVDALISLKDAIVNYFLCLKQDLNLSLRDIDTLVKNYNILLDTILKDENQVGQLLIYLFLLTLKYKHPNIYGVLIGDSTEKNKNDNYNNSPIKNAKCTSYPYVKDAIVELKLNKIMVSREHCIFRNGVKNTESYFETFSYNKGILTVYEHRFKYNIRMEYEYSVDGILFKSDLEKWEEIKNMTYSSYISQQLENFNFSADM